MERLLCEDDDGVRQQQHVTVAWEPNNILCDENAHVLENTQSCAFAGSDKDGPFAYIIIIFEPNGTCIELSVMYPVTIRHNILFWMRARKDGFGRAHVGG
jgi:hypothetical protein